MLRFLGADPGAGAHSTAPTPRGPPEPPAAPGALSAPLHTALPAAQGRCVPAGGAGGPGRAGGGGRGWGLAAGRPGGVPRPGARPGGRSWLRGAERGRHGAAGEPPGAGGARRGRAGAGGGRGGAGVPAALGCAAALQQLFPVQRLPVDPVRQHQQHFHALLRRQRLRHRLAVHELHAHLHPAALPRRLAAGQEGSAPHRPHRLGPQCSGCLGEAGQPAAAPLPRHGAGAGHLLPGAGLHPGHALVHRLCLVRLARGLHRLLHRCLREPGTGWVLPRWGWVTPGGTRGCQRGRATS